MRVNPSCFGRVWIHERGGRWESVAQAAAPVPCIPGSTSQYTFYSLLRMVSDSQFIKIIEFSSHWHFFVPWFKDWHVDKNLIQKWVISYKTAKDIIISFEVLLWIYTCFLLDCWRGEGRQCSEATQAGASHRWLQLAGVHELHHLD